MRERSTPDRTTSVEPSGGVTSVLRRNISALAEVRRQFDRQQRLQDRIATRITRFAGSMTFVALHAAMFGVWIAVNLGLVPGVPPFDPFPFVMLAMIASVEAIFLATFVLISQNRSLELAGKRDELDLQISLLAEHEITRLIQMVDGISRQLGVQPVAGAELDELKRDVEPSAVVEEIDRMDPRRP